MRDPIARASWLVALAATATALVPAAARATVDLGGYYAPVFHEDGPERGQGPDAGEYMGLSINEAMRLRGETWNGSLLTLPERQCVPHPSTYGMRGVGNLHIWEVRDPGTQAVVKLEQQIVWESQHREIWMDGRPFPPEWALHTWQGFSKGHWEGDTLVVETRNLKPGWIRRNGLALSDRAHMTEYYIRHGDVLHHTMFIEDPVYLTEPMIKTNIFRIMAQPNMGAYPCRPAVEIPRPKGEVPHQPFKDRSAIEEFAQRYDIPPEAAAGGIDTAMPEFMDVIAAYRAAHPVAPPKAAKK
ncbi:MAG TPA: hypothetical protein VL358_08590 [Caulobacteraceae bacterium]|nr:hypothetical protein [Caulobacteraceae bacterium]